MTRAIPALIALVVVAATLLAGCGEGPAEGADGTRSADLVLDWFPNADHAGIYTAIAGGHMADSGVDLVPEVPSDPAAALKQVGAGRAPFAVSYEPEVLLARSQGIPVVAVAALVGTPLNAVIVRGDRGIARPRDLEGRTVGISGLPSDRPLLDTVVRADGGDPAKVRTRSVGFNLSPALAAGRVDALVGAYWNIEAPELERRGVPVDVFRLERFGVPAYDELVLVTSDEIARDDPALVRAVVRGSPRGPRRRSPIATCGRRRRRRRTPTWTGSCSSNRCASPRRFSGPAKAARSRSIPTPGTTTPTGCGTRAS